ncbi:hypothetical protein X765_25615 [Mesorhizobium sp. LSHC440B00]|nr:hypothetical protein X765_25615 [Mesorhizobium sp. LSHC440B00]ESX36521.1 hypothetical protein X763_17000 [Mesorhizobium sp. LSHC432A00]ESX74613.1 hypothetical protein X757_18765 [Mesorhizobium sp. LSHC414A00]
MKAARRRASPGRLLRLVALDRLEHRLVAGKTPAGFDLRMATWMR